MSQMEFEEVSLETEETEELLTEKSKTKSLKYLNNNKDDNFFGLSLHRRSYDS